MTGTLINVIAIIAGSLIGIVFGARLSDNLKATVVNGMGLFTAAIGLQMFFQTQESLIVLGALIIGAILGEWWRIEDGIANLGAWLEKRFTGSSEGGASSRFVRGFLAASLLYCTGPIAIMGSIQDGLSGDFQLLAVKSVLDGFISIAFASTLGIGVMFSILPVAIYQGGISLLAGWFAWKRTLFQQRWLLRILVLSALLPQIANQVGWFTAEMGRQPWVVYGLLRTSDALSKSVTAEHVLFSLILFTVVYLILFALFIYLLNKKIVHGPDDAEMEDERPHQQAITNAVTR